MKTLQQHLHVQPGPRKVKPHKGAPPMRGMPTMPVLEVKRMAPPYRTGKSMGSPTGKPGGMMGDKC